MSRIIIDARESGTSSGRYVDKMIEYLHKLHTQHEIILLARHQRVVFLHSIAPRFKIIETSSKEFTISEQFGFRKQLKSLKADLVHFPFVQQPIWYHGRVVTTIQDLTTLRFKNPTKNPVVFTIKQYIYGWVNKIAARKSLVVLTPTSFVKNDVIAYAHIDPAKITVTYEAADKISDQPIPVTPLIGKQFIMYVGRPMPHKNLARLIQAFALLQQDFPDLCLVLAGKKDLLYEQHARTIAKQGIKNVIFTGFVSDGELRWLYEHTACYVFPSLSEGFGLPGLEAMAHGAPVASSNATCLPEVHGNAVVYFDPYDSGAVAQAIHEVLTNKELAKSMREKGYEQVSKYSWERMARQTLDAYNKALTL